LIESGSYFCAQRACEPGSESGQSFASMVANAVRRADRACSPEPCAHGFFWRELINKHRTVFSHWNKRSGRLGKTKVVNIRPNCK